MVVSIFLSKLIGPYCVVAAISVLLNKHDYLQLTEDIAKNMSIRFIWAFLALVVGLLIVNTHNVWEASWVVLITLFGWISTLKGILFFIFPDQISKIAEVYNKNEQLLKVNLGLLLLLGVFLCYKGYVA